MYVKIYMQLNICNDNGKILSVILNKLQLKL